MWSPAPARHTTVIISAAMPELAATDPMAPSRLATRSSKAATVGLAIRL